MNEMNKAKAAFIICVNDWSVYDECLFYLERLHLPAGFEKDVITIQDAPSMAAGYNAGMKSSDAKYKIYMHQDVHILNQNFIHDILRIFNENSEIGMMGCIGTSQLGKEAMAVTSWDTGKVIHNAVPMQMEFDEIEGDFTIVTALDGLLMASQYDLSWREDLMDGWDFYDISQCMEFAHAGYKIAVPRQDQPWCYHDNQSSNMTRYNFYRRRFVEEYGADGSFEMPQVWEGTLAYQNMKEQTAEIMEKLICEEDHMQFQQIFKDPSNRKYIHLKNYEIIADIDYLEERSNTDLRLWREKMSVSELLWRVRQLKYWIKRIEHQAADVKQMMDLVLSEYSIYAVIEIFVQCVVEKQYTYREIKYYFEQQQMIQELELWKLIAPGV